VRLYELAYFSHVYALFSDYDTATVDLRQATGGAVDPNDTEHSAALFSWLRRWGCRQFKIEDEEIARESLVKWWLAWRKRLPPMERTVDLIDDSGLDAIASAYEELRWQQASWQRMKTGSVAKTFGPAGAAKTLYAIRPNACPPWDEPIRKWLGLPATGDGYRRQLVRVRAELAEAVADLGPGASAAQLPLLLDRPDSSPAKLVDEHDWARYTKKVKPPPPDLFERWAAWADV